MQTLGISESTPKPENRLKALFWPRVQYPEDIDLLGTQGYWVCVVLSAFTLVMGLSRHNGAAGWVDALYFYLAGVGIRRTSRFAAASAFLIYLLGVVAEIKIAHSGGVESIFFLALLLSNVRATWLAKGFAIKQGSAQLDPAIVQSQSAVFTDVLPRLIWPVGQWLYYGLSILMFIGIAVLLARAHSHLAY